MKKLTVISFALAITFLVVLPAACKKDNGFSTTPLELEIPDGFPTETTVFANNPLTKEGFELGRRLFYDGKLSKDGNFPCASCHQQFAAFATFEHAFSHGFNNAFTTRNAPGLFNLAWHSEFHYDGGINHLEVQPLAPITATNEMAEDVENVLNKLRADSAYPEQFRKAFGSPEINSQRMLRAITQFVGSMVSADSKYDKVKKGAATFTPMEAEGYALFKANCATCHKEPLFTDLSYRNNGLDINPFINDYGRMGITRKKEDSLKFKVPSLRNIVLTYPYMHDGRFFSIEAAVEHYMSGIQQSATLDPLLRNGIPLTQGQKAAIVAFLRTLTDETFIADPRFSAPE